jgi:LysR family transcriptional regulator, glycine cleavage system transcriptional activator
VNKTRPVVGLPTLAWLRAFESAARTSSFTAAAAELNLTSGAVSYQIRALEAQLGFPLFERLSRGVKLTAMGVAYLPSVRKAFEDLADSTVGLFGGNERLRVTVNAPVSIASLWLAPQLPVFMAAHPQIDLRLSSVIWDNAVPNETTDLEIRYGYGHWHGYRSEQLLNQRIVAVCSPEMKASPDVTAAAIISRPLIHVMGYENHWLSVHQGLQLGNSSVVSGPTVDTTIAALELAASGAGYALTHRLFLTAYLATGRLVIAIDQDFVDDNSYFVVTPQRPQRIRREVQLFRDWLILRASTHA